MSGIRFFRRNRRNVYLLFALTGCFCLFAAHHSIKTESFERAKDGSVEINTGAVVQNLKPVPLHCDADVASTETVKDLKSKSHNALSTISILKRTSNCDNYFDNFRKMLQPRLDLDLRENLEENLRKLNSKLEDKREVPVRLAFSLLVHENVGIFETLLQLIFHPQHSYCIHVDLKADTIVHQAVHSIVNCFKERFPESNLFLADFSIPVYWGHISMMDAELQCLQLLDQRDSEWQFYFNLAGSELPLVPISKIEQILSEAPANQSIFHSFPTPEFLKDRYEVSYALGDTELAKRQSRWYLFKKSLNPFVEIDPSERYQIIPLRTNNSKRPPPFNLTIYKGHKNVILSRTFSKFVLRHPVAIGFRRWCEDMLIPDEAFYSTLIHITDIQDLRPDNLSDESLGKETVGNLLDDLEKRYRIQQTKDAHTQDIVGGHCIRRSLWGYQGCQGQLKREICNLSVKDLPLAVNRPCEKPTSQAFSCMFVNKLDLEVDPLSVTCLAQHVLAQGGHNSIENC
jgi:hypothetical protein